MELAGVDGADAAASEAARSDLFASHAKLGGDFASREEAQSAKAASAIWDEEAAQVEQWIGLIAQQAGVPGTLPRSLA